MKTKTLLLLLLSVSCLKGYAQKEGNIWTFSDSLGIDFNNSSGPVVCSSASRWHTLMNQSTIADSSGNLFCYTTADYPSFNSLNVYDRSHHIMPNGSQLRGHPNHTSILLPYPGIDSLICLFHFSRDVLHPDYWMFYYSLINKNLNNGFGDVILRDSLLYYGPFSDEKLAAVKHGNGRDWWVMVLSRDTGYISYLLSPSGIIQYPVQLIGSSIGALFYGKLIFSNDGTKMMSVGAFGTIDVFDFDRCSGLLSNHRDIGEHLTSQPYQYLSAAFSPNGNVIYVSTDNLVKKFYQFNLNAANITASKILLNEYLDTGITLLSTYQWHNLAPDGKIYIPICGMNSIISEHLDVIEFPDSVGTACHYTRQAFYLGRPVKACLPTMPYYGLGALPGSICDSLAIGIKELTENKNGITLFPNPSSGVFHLRLNDEKDKVVSVSVESILGSRILFLKNFSSIIDLSAFPGGLYVAHVQTQKKTYSIKIVKQ